MQPISSLGGVLSVEALLCEGQAQPLKLCCFTAWLGMFCNTLGNEDAALNVLDVRVNFFSFLVCAFLLHFLIFVLLIS